MNKDKIGFFSNLSIGVLAIGIIILVFIKYLFPVIAPFLIAWVMAMAASSPAKRISRRTHVPEKIIRLMTSIFLTIALFSLLALLVWQLTGAVWRFLTDIGEGNKIYEILLALTNPSLPIFGDGFPEELALRISDALMTMLSGVLSGIAGAVTSAVSAVPRVLLFLLVTLISLVYFSLDLERINGLLLRLFPESTKKKLSNLRSCVFSTARKYIGSYLLIMLITYVVIISGLFVLGVKRAPLIALFIAVLDILPIIGVGTVLIPWSIISFALGNHFVGIGLIVLFVVNTVVRQFVEPKIVGKSLNLHPIATLAMIYIGYALFGFSGLVIFPTIVVIFGALLRKDDAAEVA